MAEDYKQTLDRLLKQSIDRGEEGYKTIRRLFQYRFSPVLEKHYDVGFSVVDRVATYFAVPFRAVYLCGSAQTGYSYFKQRDFSEKESDLDISIVHPALFQKYSEISFEVTRGYTDLTKFIREDDQDSARQFSANLAKGFFRPDLMPSCGPRQHWFAFFNRLSNDYGDCFTNINAGIYLSEVFFEGKQLPLIQKYKESAQ